MTKMRIKKALIYFEKKRITATQKNLVKKTGLSLSTIRRLTPDIKWEMFIQSDLDKIRLVNGASKQKELLEMFLKSIQSCDVALYKEFREKLSRSITSVQINAHLR